MAKGESADLVVVGAGTVGGWASVFASEAGLNKVVVLERDVVGGGASSRAAGMVRAQGGTPDTVRLGAWSIDWYRGQDARYGTDSGFQGRGYVILAVTAADERAAHERIAMQRATGLDARWVDADEVRALIPAMGSTGFRGGSYVATDGWVDPPRNVRAYSLAMQQRGVEVRERTAFVGLRTRAVGRGRREVTGVRTGDGTIATSRVLLTGGPAMQAVATAAGARAWVGYARHQVVVTEASPDLHADTTAMAFDIGAGIYWRPEEGGLLWGMSNPDEEPGPGRSIDWPYLRRDGAPAPPPGAGHTHPRHQEGMGGHDRVHPGSFPAHRSARAPRRHGGGRRVDRQRVRSRDDVGAGGLAHRRRPRARR